MIKMIVIGLLFACTACKKKEPYDVPPPISSGKCVVNRYVGAAAIEQECYFEGYSWKCTRNAEKQNTCVRTSEATGERLPMPDAGAPTASIHDASVAD